MYNNPFSVKSVAISLLGLASVFDGLSFAQVEGPRYDEPPSYSLSTTPSYPSETHDSCGGGGGGGSGGGSGGGGSGGGGGGNGGGNGTNGGDLSYTPVIGDPDRVVDRRPVTVLQQEYPDVFNMFILALESLHDRAEDDDESYFQIAGIHGYPFITWQYPDSAIINPGREYCTHSSVIFNTWHRPYLVLLEQSLHEEAVRIANLFEGYSRDRYVRAAEDVRLPYWDWASEDSIPPVVSSETIDVIKPGTNSTAGGETNIPNPLYSYMFQNDLPSNFPGNDETIRGANPNSDLQATFEGRQQATLDVFTIGEFNDFNFALEGIHNSIHVLVGGGMATIDYSSFDPIFFLHHCNVDRLFAMWQATNPGQTVQPGRSGRTTLQLPAGITADENTPLYPFRDGEGNEWTSQAIEDITDMFEFGYSYPETPTDLGTDELITFTTNRINELYAPSTEDISFEEDSAGENEVLAPAQEPNTRTEWGCNFVYNKMELPGSYKINVYLNSNNDNSTQPRTGGNLVGVAPIFSKASDTSEEVTMNFTVPLTPALVDSNIQLRPEETVPNLRNRLYWTLERVDNAGPPSETPIEELSSLKVSVVSTLTDYKDNNDELPEITRPLTYYAPVEGKPGALSPDEEPVVGEKAPVAIDEDLIADDAALTSRVRRSLKTSAKLRYAMN